MKKHKISEINSFGKGALHKKDHRDFSFGAVPSTPYDWNNPVVFDVPIDVSDQNVLLITKAVLNAKGIPIAAVKK